ncbi:MAG: barstar family protein, partial [Asticcacaulis sp.]|uniref:barstar family protein n=1 Tax=Asticcacaulis sp. TaxID=1872648 RepID=UPI003F7C4B44
HGRNLNALIDSIVWGDINGIEPPYTIRIYKLSQAAPDAREEYKIFLKYLPECKAEYFAREGRPREVYFEIMT